MSKPIGIVFRESESVASTVSPWMTASFQSPLAFNSTRAPVKGKRLLELGAGSGLIALYAMTGSHHHGDEYINPWRNTIHSSSLINNIPLHLFSIYFEKYLQWDELYLINPPFPHQPGDDWGAFLLRWKVWIFPAIVIKSFTIFISTPSLQILNQFLHISRITSIGTYEDWNSMLYRCEKIGRDDVYLSSIN